MLPYVFQRLSSGIHTYMRVCVCVCVCVSVFVCVCLTVTLFLIYRYMCVLCVQTYICISITGSIQQVLTATLFLGPLVMSLLDKVEDYRISSWYSVYLLYEYKVQILTLKVLLD